MTVNIPQYSDYSNVGDEPKFTITTNDCTEELFSVETETGNIISKGAFGLSNTQDASNATTASFVVSGGLASGPGRGVLIITYLQGPNGNT